MKSKGFLLELKLIDSAIKACNYLFFLFKLCLIFLEIVYSFIFSLNLFCKSFNFFTIFLLDILYDLFFVYLMIIINFIDHILETCKVGTY